MKLPDVIPWYWKLGAAVALAATLAGGVKLYGAHQWQLGHDAAVSARAAQDAVAIIQRTSDNAAVAAGQALTNSLITKVKNEELAPVRERIVTQRVYVGSALCGGPAAPTQADIPTGGDGADPPRRLVREDVERDLRALKLAVEEDLATGRTCQAKARESGLVP